MQQLFDIAHVLRDATDHVLQFGAAKLRNKSCPHVQSHLPFIVAFVSVEVALRIRLSSAPLSGQVRKVALNLQEFESFLTFDALDEALLAGLYHLRCLALGPVEENSVDKGQFAAVKLVIRRAQELHQPLEVERIDV